MSLIPFVGTGEVAHPVSSMAESFRARLLHNQSQTDHKRLACAAFLLGLTDLAEWK